MSPRNASPIPNPFDLARARAVARRAASDVRFKESNAVIEGLLEGASDDRIWQLACDLSKRSLSDWEVFDDMICAACQRIGIARRIRNEQSVSHD